MKIKFTPSLFASSVAIFCALIMGSNNCYSSSYNYEGLPKTSSPSSGDIPSGSSSPEHRTQYLPTAQTVVQVAEISDPWQHAVQDYKQLKHQVEVSGAHITAEAAMELLSSVSANAARHPHMQVIADYFRAKVCIQGRSQELTPPEVIQTLDGIIQSEATPEWMKESSESMKDAMMLQTMPQEDQIEPDSQQQQIMVDSK